MMWQDIQGALAAPKGYKWQNNGKSRFSKEYKHRLIKEKEMEQIIFESENFQFRKIQGVGVNNTPWSGLEVVTKSGSLANKHIVEIKLNSNNNPRFDGEPIHYTYSNAYVGYGLRMKIDSLDETQDFINVLKDAVDFAERVNNYLFNN